MNTNLFAGPRNITLQGALGVIGSFYLANAQAKLDGPFLNQTDPGLMPEIRMIVNAGGDPIFIDSLRSRRMP